MVLMAVGISGIALSQNRAPAQSTRHKAVQPGPAVRSSGTTATQPDTSFLFPGEDLLYEVSYLGLKLGTVRIHTVRTDIAEQGTHHHVMAMIDTYEGIPFVDLHAIDSSMMDTAFYSKEFRAMEKKNDKWVKEVAHYERDSGRILIRRTSHAHPRAMESGEVYLDTLRITGDIHDGLSLFFFARANIRRQGNISIPTVAYGKVGTTHFRFGSERSTEEIKAEPDKQIRVIKLEGNAEFSGLYGMTGDFKGWFSDDAAAVPIKAELGVFLGNVKLELVGWKRAGWVPPFATEN